MWEEMTKKGVEKIVQWRSVWCVLFTFCNVGLIKEVDRLDV